MAKYSFALSDKLCREYLLFKQHSSDYDKKLVGKLLRYHTGEEFIYNNDQLQRVNIEVSPQLSIGLKKAKFDKKDLEALRLKTEYKLILTDDRSNFPYVNIKEDNITTNVVGCYYQNEARDKAIRHLKSLCEGANTIMIYDKYLNNHYEVLKSILPHKKMKFKYVAGHLDDNSLEDLRGHFANYIFEKVKDTDIRHHDRYIVIDNKYEVIITSGFEYINDPRKEMTYVVRPTKESRF